MLRSTNSVTLCQNSAFAKFWGCQKEVSKRKLHFCFFLFYVGELETEKEEKKGKAKKTHKNRFFKVVIPKCEKSKKMDFKQKLPDTICVGKEEKRTFSCTLYVLAKFFLDQTA